MNSRSLTPVARFFRTCQRRQAGITRRRGRLNFPQAGQVEILEDRVLLSATTELISVLSGDGFEVGKAKFEVEDDGQSEMKVEIRNATPGSAHQVVVAGIAVGVLEVDNFGLAEIEWSSDPDDDDFPFPDAWPGVSLGTNVSVGEILSGTFLAKDDHGHHDDSIRKLEGHLSGSGVEFSDVEYKERLNGDEVVRREFEVSLHNAVSDTTYSVYVDEILVGQITVDALSNGFLEFESHAHEPDEQPFPDNFPNVVSGSTVRIGQILSGNLTDRTTIPDHDEHDEHDGVEWHAKLRGDGVAVGEAEFETETEDGETKATLKVRVSNVEGGTSHDVILDGVTVGQIAIGAHGIGRLELTTHPDDDDESPLPTNWPGLTLGSHLRVGDLVAGEFGVTQHDEREDAHDRRDRHHGRNDDVFEHLAGMLDQDHDLRATGNYHENWGGKGEKWIRGEDDWFFITPDGNLYEWNYSSTASGDLVAVLNDEYHTDPSQLINPITQSPPDLTRVAYEIDFELDLEIHGDLHEDWGGRQEKWLYAQQISQWYFITSDGRLYEWDGSRQAAGALFAVLDAGYYEAPSQLSEPPRPAVDGFERSAALIDQELDFRGSEDQHQNWGGRQEKWLFSQAKEQWYFVLPGGGLYQWDGSQETTGTLISELNGVYYQDVTKLTDAQPTGDFDLVILAQSLDQDLGLQLTSSLHFNWGGLGEKWVHGGQDEWYFIMADGRLYEWDGGSTATGTAIALLDSTYYTNVELLCDAI